MVSSGPRRFGLNDSFGVARCPSAFGPFVLDRLSVQPHCFWSFARRTTRRYGGPIGRWQRTSDNAEIYVYGSGRWGLVDPRLARVFEGWNRVGASENLSNASYWTLSRAAVPASNAIAGPSEIPGSFGDELVATLAASPMTHRAVTTTSSSVLNPALESASDFTFTAWIKDKNARYCGLKFTPSGETPTRAAANFDLQSGTVTAGTGTITDLGDGWFRLSITGSVPTTDGHVIGFIQIHDPTNGSSNWLGDNSTAIYVAAAQIERGSAYTAYNPRSGAGAGNVLWSALYDQRGTGLDFIQANSAWMPYAAKQGLPVTENGIQSAKFVAADSRRMAVAASSALFNYLHTTGGTVHAISKANDSTVQKVLLRNTTAASKPGFLLQRASNEQWIIQCGRLDVAGVATDGTTVSLSTSDLASTANSHLLAIVDPDNATPADRLRLFQNGIEPASENVSTGQPFVEDAQGDLTLGATAGASTTWEGTITEIGVWNALLGDADREAIDADVNPIWSF